MQSHFMQCFLASLATLASFVRADYAIDDQNTTSLLYSASPGSGSHWLPYQGGNGFPFVLPNGTGITAVASGCYNSTYTSKSLGHQENIDLGRHTVVGCTDTDGCKAQIPFSGSGITIYVLHAGPLGTNASLTIDGGAPTYSVLDIPPGPNYYVPNVTLFNVQGMTTGNHMAIMSVLSWDNDLSFMLFDYALINQTTISAPTTSTSSGGLAPPTALATTIPETTATSTIHGVSPLNVGAIIGGVLGGLTALILIILAILYFRRRNRKVRVSGASDHVESMIQPFASATQRPPSSVRYTTVSVHAQGEGTVTDPLSAQVPTHMNSRSSHPDQSLLSVTNPNTSQFAEYSILPPVQGTPSGTPSEISHARIRQAHPTLTDDQADFVNNLYANDVPATAIARVIARMMAGEQRPAVDGYDSLPPPSYYHGTNNE